MDLSTLAVPLLSTVVGSFFGAWLAARFALSRFYREKVWERKTEAYTAIFEALHNMHTWYVEHQDAMGYGRELSESKKEELASTHKVAKATFERRLASETWLIPDHVNERILTLQKEIWKLDEYSDFTRIVVEGEATLCFGMQELRELVRRDLLLRPNWLTRTYRRISNWTTSLHMKTATSRKG